MGKREYMERLPDVAYGMTYRGETLSLAAAAAVLRVLREVRVAEHLEYIGELVRAAFERACAEAGVQAALVGPGARMTFLFADEATLRRETAFVLECARHGVLTNGNILPSLSHDEGAVQRSEEAFRAALARVKELSDSAREAVLQAMRAAFDRCGADPAEGDDLPAASLDVAREEGSYLVLKGWLLEPDPESWVIEVSGPSGATCLARRVERQDVAAAFPSVPTALHSGFEVALPREQFVTGDRFDFRIRATRAGDALFDCPVTKPLADLAPEIRAPRLAPDGVLHL